MKNAKGNTLVITLIILAVAVVTVFMVANSYRKDAKDMKNAIEAAVEVRRTTLANGGAEVADVFKIYKISQDKQIELAKAYSGVLQGGGDVAAAKQGMGDWLRVHMPGLPEEVTMKVMRKVEVVTARFVDAEKNIIAYKQLWKNQFSGIIDEFVLNQLGFAETDMDQYQVISTQKASKAEDSGIRDNGFLE